MFLNRCISNVLTLTQEKKKKRNQKKVFLSHTYLHTHTHPPFLVCFSLFAFCDCYLAWALAYRDTEFSVSWID